MMFDPFGDYETRGYLRNNNGADAVSVRRLEHAALRGALDKVLDYLKSRSRLAYTDILHIHATLFSSIYPWAGQDRSITAPHSAIGWSGNFVLLSHPADCARAMEMALHMAATPANMRKKPGEILGLLVHAHPFLEGNARIILIVFIELCRRADMNVDWAQINKPDYMAALTRELEEPGKGHLDIYLKPFLRLKGEEKAPGKEALRALPDKEPVEQFRRGPVIAPKRDLDPSVSPAEIDSAFETHEYFQEALFKLENMASQVYADPGKVIEDIRHCARFGEIGERAVVKRIEQNPQFYGSFKGSDSLSSSTQERRDYRNAVALRATLRGVSNHVISMAHDIRQSVIDARRQLAERGRIELFMPDAGLMKAIQQKLPLSPAQTAEIDKIMSIFEHRFGEDVGRVRTAHNRDVLARKHGLDMDQITKVRRVLRALVKGQVLAREQAQDDQHSGKR